MRCGTGEIRSHRWGVEVEARYELPDGDAVRVIDTASAAGYLGAHLALFRDGDLEPLFFGDTPKPEAAVITFDQWLDYRQLVLDRDGERRVNEEARRRAAAVNESDIGSFATMDEVFEAEGLSLDPNDYDLDTPPTPHDYHGDAQGPAEQDGEASS